MNNHLDRVVNKFLSLSVEEAYGTDRKRLPQLPQSFRFIRSAGSLVGPSKTCASHHRAREQHYVTELEAAEKKLREEGVSVELIDIGTADYTAALVSGSMARPTSTFQPKIDQQLFDQVKRAKAKVLEHRGKAEQFEKYARAFACAPEYLVDLSVEDAHFFRLES